MTLPPWVVLHVPHDSTEVPREVRDQFLLPDGLLTTEIDRMTDHHTLAMFADGLPPAQVVQAPVSRLVVDVERFVLDAEEPMAQRGHGVVYAVTSELHPLRRSLTAAEREALLSAYYVPHHARLEQAVADVVAMHGRCLVLDCHSFPDRPLPYEQAKPGAARHLHRHRCLPYAGRSLASIRVPAHRLERVSRRPVCWCARAGEPLPTGRAGGCGDGGSESSTLSARARGLAASRLCGRCAEGAALLRCSRWPIRLGRRMAMTKTSGKGSTARLKLKVRPCGLVRDLRRLGL